MSVSSLTLERMLFHKCPSKSRLYALSNTKDICSLHVLFILYYYSNYINKTDNTHNIWQTHKTEYKILVAPLQGKTPFRRPRKIVIPLLSFLRT